MTHYTSLDLRHQKTLIAKKADVMHKIEKGILFDVYYDTETTDLDKRFAEILQFGGLVTDLAGNILSTADFRAKPSPYSVISPLAWVVQRLNEERLSQGDPQYIFAGKVMQFFRHATQLHEAHHRHEFLKSCKPGKFKFSDGTSAKYYAYPLLDENGEEDWESVRIHENLKKLYFHDKETGEWHKRNIASMTYGYNNVNADDQWLWTMLHMAGAENIFITHLVQSGKYRADVLRMVEAAVAAGPQGENGVKAGGSKIPSFSQGAILEKNTHIGNELRNLMEGIVMPDGSQADLDQLHGAYKDSFALAGIMRFLRRQVPNIVTQMEKNSISKDVIESLTEKKGGFGDHPIRTYIDKSYPYVTGMMVTLVGTDQYRHNPKVALVYNLGINPEEFRFNGKSLFELEPDEFAHLIKKGIGNQNGLFKIVRTHQSPRLFDKETGFSAGFNNDLSLPELHHRAKFLRDQTLIDKIMKGLRIAQPRLEGPDRLMLPQPEEELFTFSTLELYDPEAGEDVQVHLIKNKIERLADDARKHAMQIKKFWLKAIEPDEDILLNDFDEASSDEFEAAKKWMEKIENLNKKLKENNGPQLPPPDEKIVDKTTAFVYKAKLLFTARNLFATGQLQDIGHHFWFENADGQKIDEKELRSWDSRRLHWEGQKGNLNVRYETLNTTAPIIDRILQSLGCENILGDKIVKQMEAVRSVRLHGIPSLNGQDRWLTISNAEKYVQKILNNEIMEADVKAIESRLPGAWETFVTKQHDAQSSLGSYMSYFKSLKETAPDITPVRLARVGIHPISGTPLEKLDYEVDVDKAVTLIVPERYLENPPIEPVDKKPVWVVGIKKEFNKTSLAEEIHQGRDIILQGAATGKLFHLAKAKMITSPPKGSVWKEFYELANARYIESGLNFPSSRRLVTLTGEGPYPIHEMVTANLNEQSLKVPKSHFEGLLDHKFAGYQAPLCGIMVRDDGLDLKEGAIRLLEGSESDLTPTGWEVATKIEKVQRLTISQIKQMNNEDANRYGYATTDHMLGEIITLFTDKQLDPNAPSNTVLVVDFGGFDGTDPRLGVKYFNPQVQKNSGRYIDYEDLAQRLEITS